MRSPVTRLVKAAIFGVAFTGLPATAGIDLITEPAPPGEQIDLEIEDYVPVSGAVDSAASEKKTQAIYACDVQAAHPGNTENPNRVAGVSYKDVDGSKALAACLEALALDPENMRMRYQLARAKQASGQGRDAIRDLTDLANEGYVAAINNLGATYQIGIGVRRDYKKAVGWYEKAAAKDFVPSMAILGWLNHMGLGTPQSNEKAVEWYTKASDGGSASATHNLGHMYLKGSGVDVDPERSADLFRRSAEGGFGLGMTMTAWSYQTGSGVDTDADRAVEWYNKGADIGEASAMNGLAGFYDAGGAGTAREPEKAAEWFVKALQAGHAATRARLIDRSETLQPETRRAIQARLTVLGFNPGVADGVFGGKTFAAIEEAFESR